MQSTIDVLRSVIRSRRSIFQGSYTTDEIPVEVIREILDSANYAPTHKLTEPWRFVVFRNMGKLRLGVELARLYKENTPPGKYLQKKFDSILHKVKQSNCIIAINVQLHPEKIPEFEEIAAVAAAVQNMWLTATALKVGCYWSTPEMIHSLGPFLELGENEKCIGLFYMGYHHEFPTEARRSSIEEKVRWVEK